VAVETVAEGSHAQGTEIVDRARHSRRGHCGQMEAVVVIVGQPDDVVVGGRDEVGDGGWVW